MNDHEPTSPLGSLPDRPESSPAPGPSVAASSGGVGAAPPPPPPSEPDRSASATMTKKAHWPQLRRVLSTRRRKIGSIVAAALMTALIALSVSLATSPSGTSTASSAAAGHSAPASASPGRPGFGGGGSNARSGPAAGGASGTVGGVTTSSFTMTTSTGQTVTVDEASSTTYQNGMASTLASAITTGENVLVLGTTNGTTIAATQVTMQPTSVGSTTSTAVVPFQRGAPTTSKQVGQIPANYSQGSGTIINGTAENRATEGALAAYPGGVVDRVVQLSNGQYNVHYIGVNWPHHIFVNQTFQVIGAE